MPATRVLAVTNSLIDHGHLLFSFDGGELTESGSAFMNRLGGNVILAPGSRRAFCRACLDWNERRPHVAGTVGAAIANLAFEKHWIRRRPKDRSVEVSDSGFSAFREIFAAKL